MDLSEPQFPLQERAEGTVQAISRRCRQAGGRGAKCALCGHPWPGMALGGLSDSGEEAGILAAVSCFCGSELESAP